MTVIITSANSKIGPALASALRDANVPYWSMHRLFEGTPGREGVKWAEPLPAAARAAAILAAIIGEVPVVMVCKSEDELWKNGTFAALTELWATLPHVPQPSGVPVSWANYVKVFEARAVLRDLQAAGRIDP